MSKKKCSISGCLCKVERMVSDDIGYCRNHVRLHNAYTQDDMKNLSGGSPEKARIKREMQKLLGK